MAEGGLFSHVERKDEEGEKEDEELCRRIEEISVDERERKMARCESCVRKRPRYDDSMFGRIDRASQWYGRVAVFLCFLCEMYVCGECLSEHKLHEGMNVRRQESEREEMEGQSESEKNKEKGLGKKTKRVRLEAESERKKEKESDRIKEQRDSERMFENFIDKLMNENETERRKELKKSHVSIRDRVEVKHELDCNCMITGLCGLENKMWVVCDWINFCIKIFKVGSHVLQRYVRFVDFAPWDVTEIHLKQNSAEPNLVSGSSSDISAPDRADLDKQCLIAVTLPGNFEMMFIDLSEKRAKLHKKIRTEERCTSIQFYDDKIFTVGKGYSGFRYFVYIKSTDGDTLNKFNTDMYSFAYDPHLAVVSGRVYLTDGRNREVQCRTFEGKLISEFTVEGSMPSGISVDPDNNVYVCARDQNKVYKLDADLTRYTSELDQTVGYIEQPLALCCYRDKLFIYQSFLRNFVTVVRLL